MNLLLKLNELVKSYPNDYDLGGQVRKLVHDENEVELQSKNFYEEQLNNDNEKEVFE